MAEINIITVINHLRPRVERGRNIGMHHLINEAIRGTPFKPRETRAVVDRVLEAVIEHVKQGDFVKFGALGSFSVSCDKNEALHLNYRPPNTMTATLADGFQGEITNNENFGLDEEGYAARWLELHPDDIVVMRDKTVRKL